MIAVKKIALITSLLITVFALPGNLVFAVDNPAISTTESPIGVVPQVPVDTQNSGTPDAETKPSEAVSTEAIPGATVPSASIRDLSASAALVPPPVVGSAVFNANPYTMVFSLILVVALIFGLAWLMRRVGPGVFTAGQSMKVIAALPVGQREKAVLIEVGEQQLLLGVAAGRVTLLKDFDQPVMSHRASAGGEFSSKLKQFLHQQQTPQKRAADAQENVSSVQK